LSSGPDPKSKTTERFGRYEIIEQIATGGMAKVYKVAVSGDHVLSLKKILPDFSQNEEFIHMFLEEAKISLHLQHPNIVRVIDFGQLDSSYYLAMEYVFGQNLGSLLKRSVSSKIHIPIPVACYLILQACRGLDYAHNLTDSFGNTIGVIHRDISPPNILVSYNGEAKILDFGIAKAVRMAQGRVTRSGVLKGKFSYMSPEQSRGEDLTPQSDVFSLGIVFWELLASQSLFYSKDELETLERVRKAKVQAPSKVRKSIPTELDKIILKALDPKLKRRYTSCSELADAIEQFMDKNHPYCDHREVAKYVRLLFASEFQEKRGQAIKESWKDVFVSGGADDEIMLDRAHTFSSPTQTKKRMASQPTSLLTKLIYDPKWGGLAWKWTRVAFLVSILVASGLYLFQSEHYKNILSPWASQTEVEPTSKTSFEPKPIPSSPIEARGFQWWLDRARQFQREENLEDALTAYERALEINPFHSEALVAKHFVRIRLDGAPDSCQWFRTQRDIERADKIFASALCLEIQDQKSRARQTYVEFVREFPQDLRSSEANEKFQKLSSELD
jgi:serine/threonine-protein kinase